jgi:hypothetical protein
MLSGAALAWNKILFILNKRSKNISLDQNASHDRQQIPLPLRIADVFLKVDVQNKNDASR